jgi:hypothetical protein
MTGLKQSLTYHAAASVDPENLRSIDEYRNRTPELA